MPILPLPRDPRLIEDDGGSEAISPTPSLFFYSIIVKIRFEHRGGGRLYRLRHPCNRILAVKHRYPACLGICEVNSHYVLHVIRGGVQIRHVQRKLWGGNLVSYVFSVKPYTDHNSNNSPNDG